ncbi:MAG: hypothetical protein AB7F75_03510 [Planctomycetota bacterium]
MKKRPIDSDFASLKNALIEAKVELKTSEDSVYAGRSVEQVVAILDSQIESIETSKTIDRMLLANIFGPTASIQEISMNNGWSKKYMKIADVIDLYTGG